MSEFINYIPRLHPRASFIIGTIIVSVVVILAPLFQSNFHELPYSTYISGSLLVWVICSVFYRSQGSTSASGWLILSLAMSILSVGIIMNLSYFTIQEQLQFAQGIYDNGGLSNPDSLRYWLDALYHYTDGREGYASWFHQQGYGFLISWLWIITGKSMLSALLLNALFIMASIILSGIICRRIIGANHHSSTIAMGLTMMVCYYLNSGTLILKEAPLCFAMTMAITGLTRFCSKPATVKSDITLWCCFLIGVLLVTFLRYNYSLYLLLAVPFLYRRHESSATSAAIAIVVSLGTWLLAKIIISHYGVGEVSDTGIITGYGQNDSFMFDNQQHQSFNTIFEGYFSYPMWKKLLLLPVTAIVQFLIPFPWGFDTYAHYGPTLAYARIAYPWYAIGALILYYLWYAIRRSPQQLIRLSLWAILVWLIPAYLFAGTVSRYTLPILPMLIPAAVYVITRHRNDKSLKIWGIIYSIALIATLSTAYYIQHSAI